MFDAYRVNINTGELDMIAQNPGNIITWHTDHNGQLRAAKTSDGVNQSLLYRDTEKEDFEVILTTSFKETLQPITFTVDNKNLYVTSNIGRDKTAIYEYDIKNKQPTNLIFEHSEVDVAGLMKSEKRKKITGAYYFLDKSAIISLMKTGRTCRRTWKLACRAMRWWLRT